MRQINTVQELRAAALDRKSVTCPSMRCFSGPIPAAWAINFIGVLLARLFDAGLFIYEKKNRKEES